MRQSTQIPLLVAFFRGPRILLGLATLAVAGFLIHGLFKGAEPPPTVGESPPSGPTPAEALPAPPAEPIQPSVIPLGNNRFRIGLVEFNKTERTLTIPAAVLMREGVVEYLLVTRRGMVHESVFVTDADPQDVHLAALLLGIQPSPDLGPTGTTAKAPGGAALKGSVEWDRNGPPALIHLHETLALAPAGENSPPQAAPATLWLYSGSRIARDGTFVAQRGGSIISIIRDSEALINYPPETRDNDDIHIPNASVLPKLEHPVRIVLKLR